MLNSLPRVFFTILIAAAFIYVLVTACLFVFQKKFVYFPRRDIQQTPIDIHLNYKEIQYRTSDNVKISAWYIPAENPRATLLFCHGNAGNISTRIESIIFFHQLRLNILIFDYRGYGQSEGQTNEEGTYLDAEGAWNYLIHNYNLTKQQIIIFGRSLGGAVAAWLAQKYKPRGLIIESSFTSVNDIASEMYPIFPVKILSRFNYNTRKYLSEIKCPLLVIHSKDDEMIPFSHGLKLFENAPQPKQFLVIKGSHNEGYMLSKSRYLAGIKTFLDSITFKTPDS